MSTPTAMPSLALQAATAVEPARPRTTPAMAFSAARERFRRGERLDMVSLAAELGVSRGTLYRWTGDRDQLLADVVWIELRDLAAYCVEHAEGAGLPRIEAAYGSWLELVASAPALRSLLANEGESGLRLLTSPVGPVRPRLVAMVAALITDEVARSGYRPPAAPEILADGIVSFGERFLHNGGEPTLNPDVATCRVVVGLLLRES